MCGDAVARRSQSTGGSSCLSQVSSFAPDAPQPNPLPLAVDGVAILNTRLDVLLGVQQVVKQRLFVPGHAGALVGGAEGVALRGARSAADQAVQVGALLVAARLQCSVGRADQTQLLDAERENRGRSIFLRRSHLH